MPIFNLKGLAGGSADGVGGVPVAVFDDLRTITSVLAVDVGGDYLERIFPIRIAEGEIDLLQSVSHDFKI